MDTRRLILLIVFSFSILMLWEAWNRPIATPAETTRQRDDVPAATVVPGTAAPTAAGAVPPGAQSVETSRQLIEVRTDVMHARIDPLGGSIVELDLIGHPDIVDRSQSFVLLGVHRASAQSGLIRTDTAGPALPNHKSLFTAPESRYQLADGQDSVSVQLEASSADGVKFVKTFIFRRGDYQIDVRHEMINGSAQPVTAQSYFHLVRDGQEPEGSMMMAPTFTGPAVYTEADHYKKIPFGDIDKNKAKYPEQADNGWIAMVQHYFVAAWTPPDQVSRSYYVEKLDEGLYRAGLKLPMPQAAPGQSVAVEVPLYAGPQEQERLREISPELDVVVDYGWLKVIAKPLFEILKFLHGLLGNWGLAIIALTVLIKIVFFPLSAASYKSMAKMRVVAPRLQKLKEQYGDDRAKMNQAMMELYKTEKINPLGGCLPVLVQIPVFIALYWVLLSSVELRQAPFYGWIKDLSLQDPLYILPALMMVSMFIQTKLNPTPPDPVQAKVMMIMPFAFGIMFFFFPAGLVLYWLVNNILSIAQQWQITRMIEASQGKPEASAKR
ncbi:MAG TPA: membrane protein insertase YidC [Burkholderiales bacterium]|nr:membrane protein insertase YidC [Burkholderiales bacterium]